MNKQFRNGALGALIDEYERAIEELKVLLQTIDTATFTRILDAQTKDNDCRSVQTITNHVVRSGYGYANYIRKYFNEDFTERKTNYELQTSEAVCSELDKVMKYTEATLSNKWKLSQSKLYKTMIHTTWGQNYDIDQLLEHAIVHILRHRRQIEKLLSKQ